MITSDARMPGNVPVMNFRTKMSSNKSWAPRPFIRVSSNSWPEREMKHPYSSVIKIYIHMTSNLLWELYAHTCKIDNSPFLASINQFLATLHSCRLLNINNLMALSWLNNAQTLRWDMAPKWKMLFLIMMNKLNSVFCKTILLQISKKLRYLN